jgi:subtilase-type serine protease
MNKQINPLALAIALSSLSSVSINTTAFATPVESIHSETVIQATGVSSEAMESVSEVPVEAVSDPLSVQFTESQAASLDFSTFNAFKQSLSAVLTEVLPEETFVTVSEGLQLISPEAGAEAAISSESSLDMNQLFDGFFEAQETEGFSALSHKKELLLNLGAVYGFEVSFSVKATEVIADERVLPEKEESGFGSAGVIAGLAGAGLAGGGGGGGGGSSSSSTFLDSGTSLSYDSSLLTTWANRTEFDNVNLISSRLSAPATKTGSRGQTTTLSSSDIHPYVLLGVDDAYAYGLSGSGQTVGILDGGIVSSHLEKPVADITTFGSISSATSGSSHGSHVAGLIAANYDGDTSAFVPNAGLGSYTGVDAPLNNGMMGVAYAAKLFVADKNGFSSDMVGPDHWADVYINAVSNDAIAMNNSWGWSSSGSELPISTITAYMTANGATLAEALQNFSPYAGQSSTDWQDFINALNAYQDTGVIVWAQSNDYSFNEIDMSAGLPVADMSLADAWIAVINVNVEGSSISSSSVKRFSGKCGSAKEFCLAADGVELVSLDDDSRVDYTNKTGTSMAAPQISGMVALLNEAFPTLTPAQIVDRLLASADNSFFTAEGTTTFTNGITHGYSEEFGHGIPDMYAALNPITTSRAQNSLLLGNNVADAQRYSLESTRAAFGPAFGNSVNHSLRGHLGYFHDGLNTPFAFEFSRITPESSGIARGALAVEIPEARSEQTTGTASFKSNLASNEIFNGNQSLVIETPLGFGSSQMFFANNVHPGHFTTDPSKLLPSIHSSPYMLAATNGNAVGVMDENDGAPRSLIVFFQGRSSAQDLKTIGVAVGRNYDLGRRSRLSFEGGVVNEHGGLLDSGLSSAFAADSTGQTVFFTTSGSRLTEGGSQFRATASIGSTQLGAERFGLIEKMSAITSSTFAVEFVKPLNKQASRQLFVAVSQPLRVEHAGATFRIPNLTEIGGDLSFSSVDVKMEPNGRQIDLSFGFAQRFLEGSLFLVATATDDVNHIETDTITHGLKLGVEFPF